MKRIILNGNSYDDIPDIPMPICPICQNECNDLYLTEEKMVIGCECCITKVDAWDYDPDN